MVQSKGARTRTYHGWLIAALDPPSQRTLLLSHLDASLEVAQKVVALSTNFWGSGKIAPTGFKLLRSFNREPIPNAFPDAGNEPFYNIGDAPHQPQGAIAQAWSVAEVMRHWPEGEL